MFFPYFAFIIPLEKGVVLHLKKNNQDIFRQKVLQVLFENLEFSLDYRDNDDNDMQRTKLTWNWAQMYVQVFLWVKNYRGKYSSP